MNNNINIAEILKDCPKGTKLYSTVWGNVELVKVISTYGIKIQRDQYSVEKTLFPSGRYLTCGECILFPSSEIRDWGKFFKRGDVVIKNGGGMAAVFDGWANNTYTEFNTTINLYCDDNTGEEEVCDTLLFRKATEEERKQFIEKAERTLKGKYNPDTLRVEPVKPECMFKPFDKVLVRDTDEQAWCANYFSHYKNDPEYFYVCINGIYHYCIPYNEHTAHLLGTTDPYTEGGSK